MKNFYCNICEEDVVLQNGECPKCKTNWDKIINDTISDDSQPFNMNQESNNDNFFQEEKDVEVQKITEDCMHSNINFFLTWASIGKIFMIIIGIIIAFISLVEVESTDGYSLILLVVSAGFIFAGIVFENNLKWKAYMLHTNMNKIK